MSPSAWVAVLLAGTAGSTPMPAKGTAQPAVEKSRPPEREPGDGLRRRTIALDSLCVTSGASGTAARGGGKLTVDAPTFRAVSSRPSEARAQLAFTYLGPTRAARALGSGAVRRQLGLKLRAQNACNLVYVMWRLEPKSELVVSIKRNPGQRASAECGNRGYRNVEPRAFGPLPAVATGSSHVLRAELDGERLRVTVDGARAWEGALGRESLALEGPVGVRSDNVRFEGELSASGALSPVPCAAAEDAE